MEPFNTPFGEVTPWENGINKVVTVSDLLTKEQMYTHFEIVKKNIGENAYGLVDVAAVKKVTKEFRDYCATAEAAAYTKAVAILVGSGFSRIAGNLYLNFNKPKNPTKLFTNEEKAIEWLLGQMKTLGSV